MGIHTILFDLDGTLIDTNELIIESFKHTFDTFNIPYTLEELSTYNGPPLVDTFKKVNPNFVEEMLKTYREHNLSHHEQYVRLFPNVLETVKRLHGKNYKLAIVTTKLRDSALVGIEITGLKPYFETIITLDDVACAKPHPEPVYKALEALNSEPSQAIMVGDNYHDIIAGQRAGTLTAGVAWSRHGSDYFVQYEPTYMLNDMLDLLKIIKSLSEGE